MAEWLTQADLEAALGSALVVQYTDDNADGAVDANVMASVLSRAQRAVESSLGAYVLPSAAPWPAALVDLGVRMARKILHERRMETYTDGERKIDEDLETELEEIREGDRVVAGLTMATRAAVTVERADDTEPVFLRQSGGTDPLDEY
jgi:phage gp36-like protein